MFKIIFKISEIASKEAKRDFSIDQILEDNEKVFDNISEYNQYVQVIERISEKNQKLNLDGNDYSIHDLRTITTSNLSDIILEVTVSEYVPTIDWGKINDYDSGGYSGKSNWYITYGNQQMSDPYNINIGTGTTTINTNSNGI